jgi:hypothetical protein
MEFDSLPPGGRIVLKSCVSMYFAVGTTGRARRRVFDVPRKLSLWPCHSGRFGVQHADSPKSASHGRNFCSVLKKRAGILTMRFSFPQTMILKTGDVFHE